MKIALALSGYFDSKRDSSSLGLDGFNHIKNRILDNNNVDVYIHSWDLENRNVIEDLYGPWIKESVFEEQINFKPAFYDNELDKYPIRQGVTMFWNVFSQFYSIQQTFKLIEEHYDVAIKARFDLGRINRQSSGPFNRNNPYAVQCINFDSSLDMSQIYMAKWQQSYLDNEGPADMWFYSGWENMQNFCRLYDIARSDVRYNSEYAKWAIESSNDPHVTNTIKAWKWFFIKTGLWDKKFLLDTEWE
mgnify:CR=1 FL=1